MFCGTSSHMWDNQNLPIFLLRDGSLTLMYMALFLVQVIPAYYGDIVDTDVTARDVVMVIIIII